MLKPNEIFARMSPQVATQLFTFLTEKEKPLYKATIDSLAKQRKLRPVFVERKPRAERNDWMKENLGRKQSEPVAAHLLQIWLVGAHAKLLCDFLDGFGIAHDENGTIDNLPSAPPKEDLVRVIDSLLANHEPGVVSVYLHAFQAFDEKGWAPLEELLAEDPRLQLGQESAPEKSGAGDNAALS
ncbi:MAG: hypothetical protein V4710_11225 [Verrucomicrobiota bacterium]